MIKIHNKMIIGFVGFIVINHHRTHIDFLVGIQNGNTPNVTVENTYKMNVKYNFLFQQGIFLFF